MNIRKLLCRYFFLCFNLSPLKYRAYLYIRKMQAFNAEIPELVRSQRKDGEHIEGLKKSFNWLAQYSFGPQLWIKWQKEISVLAELSYYATTTLSGLQTLGEEYVTLIQVHGDGLSQAVPSFFRRSAFIALQVLGPYLFEKTLSKLKQSVLTTNGEDETLEGIFTFLQRSGLQYLHRIHLAFFYITGGYYHVAKRLFGVRYLSLRAQSHLDVLKIFKWLGYMSLFEILLSTVFWCYTIFKVSNRKKILKRNVLTDESSVKPVAEKSSSSSSSFRCDMCLENKPPACTPCGHLFCWDCLIVQAAELKTCPLCRMAIAPSRIVPLLNL